MYIDIYFFNWTNPEKVWEGRPQFTQVGPYRYYVKRSKVGLVWNDNDTVTFRQMRHWYFDAENSNGSLTDSINVVDIIPLKTAANQRKANIFEQIALSSSLFMSAHKINAVRTVKELLFDGYTDNLLYFGNTFYGEEIPSAFGWFYQRNGSDTNDGLFNMATGAKDIREVGQIRRWNNGQDTGFYRGSCGRVQGSTGEVFPPDVTPEDKLSLFTPDLCRTIHLDYKDKVEVGGVEGLRFAGGADTLGPGGADSCFCEGECPPTGLLNMTQCRSQAPIFISYPHFYKADPRLLENVSGLQPDPEKHEFTMTVEPTLGATIDLKARFQINLLVKPNPHVLLYNQVPRPMYMPVMWFDERATLNTELASELDMMLKVPLMGRLLAWSLLLLGVVLVAVSLARDTSSPRLPQFTLLAVVRTAVAAGADPAHFANKTSSEVERPRSGPT
ncbi:hypothetical protein AAG570_006760 [Ranatra chinensis]|uniref:Uncharacterized protein n=1 Tax=Ranatra chinensis TaxID=642074 RepID=A0ABD0ZBZ6_9HEMI